VGASRKRGKSQDSTEGPRIGWVVAVPSTRGFLLISEKAKGPSVIGDDNSGGPEEGEEIGIHGVGELLRGGGKKGGTPGGLGAVLRKREEKR